MSERYDMLIDRAGRFTVKIRNMDGTTSEMRLYLEEALAFAEKASSLAPRTKVAPRPEDE